MPEVHTTNHQRFQKKVDISHNLQYLCTPNQKVYHLQHPRGIPERKHFHDPFRMRPASSRGPASPMRKARMAESVDALVSNTSGAIRAGSIPALGTFLSRKSLIFKDLRFFFWFLHHGCTTRNSQITGIVPGIKCIFTGKLLSVPSFFRVSRAVSLCFCTRSVWKIGEGYKLYPTRNSVPDHADVAS